MQIDDAVRRQIEATPVARDRPLLVCDADEVLLQFLAGLEAFLEERGLYLDLASYALTGNIRERTSGEALAADAVQRLLEAFFVERTGRLEPVPGAAEALAALAGDWQILVLSNVPPGKRQLRAETLARHGMPYPVIANAGLKGPAVALLAAQTRGPVVFVDDIPKNIDSVAELAGHVVRLHFVADPRLARLIGRAGTAHARHDDWPAARAFIAATLDARQPGA